MFSAATKEAANDTIVDAKATTSSAKRDLRDASKDAHSELAVYAERAGREVRNLIDGASDQLSHAGDCVTGEIRNNPIRSSAIARLDVKGIVTISAPYVMPDEHPAWQIQLYSYFKTYLPKTKGKPGTGWFDMEAFKGHISYPLNPIRSAAELKILLDKMHTALPKVNVPVLLIHSKDDVYVVPENMQQIYAGLVALHASDKTKLYVTGSGNVVTRDAARHQVFEAARDFIRRIDSQS